MGAEGQIFVFSPYPTYHLPAAVNHRTKCVYFISLCSRLNSIKVLISSSLEIRLKSFEATSVCDARFDPYSKHNLPISGKYFNVFSEA